MNQTTLVCFHFLNFDKNFVKKMKRKCFVVTYEGTLETENMKYR